ncbi:potassium voltage-gated channel subfamily KQT member 5 [Hydra vulgaris]|uniref:potassium voltage-gated channel subfamily KQT member 5 n=1 Tax=Hydra vulgaris TaxID=6087 RepID=UPI0001926EF2|nr:potassium voltage-gated channel subfamily KQT member 5 [Hydra vulgaris]
MENISTYSRNKKWYKQKKFVYNLLDKPRTKLAYTYHIVILLIIIGNMFLSFASTIPEIKLKFEVQLLLFVYEFVLLIIFIVEYFIRLSVCSSNVMYRGLSGKLIYIRSFYMVIDIIVIISSIIIVFSNVKSPNLSFLRYVRIFLILRLLRMDRTRGDLHTMWHAIYSHRKELLTCYFSCIVVLLLGSYAVFLIESNRVPSDGRINNMITGLYWGIITFTTIGYGDYTPHTWYGKLITSLLSMVGCAFFALPAGILGSGFALQVSKQKKEKGSIKIKNPAALLIQCAWRGYAVRNPNLTATWSYFLMKKVAAKEKAEAANQKVYASNFIALVPDKEVIEVANQQIKKSKTKALNKPSNDKIMGIKLKKNPKPYSGFEDLIDIFQKNRGSNNWSMDIQIKYKLVYSFMTILKLILASKSFSDTRYPYVNIEQVLQTNNNTLSCSLSHLREMKSVTGMILSELNDLKKEIRELKGFKNSQRRLTRCNSENIVS